MALDNQIEIVVIATTLVPRVLCIVPAGRGITEREGDVEKKLRRYAGRTGTRTELQRLWLVFAARHEPVLPLCAGHISSML